MFHVKHLETQSVIQKCSEVLMETSAGLMLQQFVANFMIEFGAAYVI